MALEFPSHQELKEIWAEQRRNGEAVRMMADDGDKPETGRYYTVSKTFDRGDGSWDDCFWQVLTINGPKAFVRIHDGNRLVERFVDINNRAWYLADDAWKAKSDKGAV